MVVLLQYYTSCWYSLRAAYIWCLVYGSSCLLIIPKPGIAILAELAAGAGETIVMGKFDIPTIIYALQGVACEIIFAIFKYQSRSAAVAMLAGLVTALATFPVDYFYGYLNEVAGWNLFLFILFRSISGIVITGLVSIGLLEHLIKRELLNSLDQLLNMTTITYKGFLIVKSKNLRLKYPNGDRKILIT